MEALRCRELVALITDYLDDALEPADRIRFEQHLSWCEGCERYLDDLRRTLRIAGRLRGADLTPPGREALLAAFRRWAAGAPG